MKLGRSSGSPEGYFDDAIPCKWHDVIRNFCFHNTIKNLLINTSVADVEEYPSNSPLYSRTCSQMFPSFVHDNFGHAVNFLPRILLSVSIFSTLEKNMPLYSDNEALDTVIKYFAIVISDIFAYGRK